jgi:NAD(P)-dependent dehydrogenase (short-subunit alcohol dehydrogenase family)
MRQRNLLVLGASDGNIGEAVARRLADPPSVFDYIVPLGAEDLDVTREEDMQRIVHETGATDVVFSVGINKLDWIHGIDQADFMEVMETNVWGFANLIKALDLQGGKPCNVVAVTSDAAWRPMRTSLAYCASKAALEMAVRVASREYAPIGWRINGVAPGKVEDTPMTRYVDDAVLRLRGWTVEASEQYELGSTPLGRKVTKEEVAQVIEQVLLGPAAQTGEIIAVNGGR